MSLVVGIGIVILTAELLKSLAGRLGDEEGGEATEKHEESVNFQDVIHPRGSVILGSTAGAEGGNGTLSNDGANLSGSSRDTVRGRSVAGGENFTRNDESSSVGT